MAPACATVPTNHRIARITAADKMPLVRITRWGLEDYELPFTFRDRTAGVSKMSGSIVREALLLVVRLWVADFRGRRQRRALGG